MNIIDIVILMNPGKRHWDVYEGASRGIIIVDTEQNF